MSSKLATTLNDYLNTWIGTRKKMSNEQIKSATLRQMMDSGAINSSILNSPMVTKTNPNHTAHYGGSIMDYITDTPLNIRIHRVANGFLVQSATREGDRATTHIATTIEQVHEIITTELVTKKLEGK